MSLLISEVVHRWLHERRIISEVAEEMGKSVSTLSAELRPSRTNAKLGADDLIPLFNAVRQIGYGRELDGILYSFIAELKGDDLPAASDDDLLPEVLKLTSSVGDVFQWISQPSRTENTAELERILDELQSQVLPAALQLERLVSSRLRVKEAANEAKNSGSQPAPVQPVPNR
jgi:hypothetical protein